MKIEEHSSLWHAIQQFPLDDPHAEITFSRKLSAKQNWSPNFTERVVEEYRKFIFLCCISPNGASPSQAVDEAWHLHLTYTRSYWIDLCKNTLSKDIHHHPSQGGDAEDQKHLDWYAATLILYQSVFESLPPNDIWPPPREHVTPLTEPARPNRKHILALVIMLLLLPFLISAYQHRVLFPFSLTGPEFLGFFPLLAISCIIGYIILQRDRYHTFPDLAADSFPEVFTVFETTLFLNGKKRLIQTAILDLLRRNLLEITDDESLKVRSDWYFKPMDEQNPLISGFLQEERSCVTYEMIAADWYRSMPAKLNVLQQLHELANRKVSFFKRNHVLLIPFTVGIIQVMQGLAISKPVSYLFWEMIVLLAVTLVVVGKFSRKAWMYKKVNETVQSRRYVGLLYSDNVVSDFAMKGNAAITGFSDGLALIVLFGANSITDRVGHTVTNFIDDMKNNIYSNDGGCSGGGGGCSGGGSCGGGWGGGGCGGCGS